MDRCPIHTFPFPFLNRKGFPQPGRIPLLEGHSLLPDHQDFEQREREDRARESEWIPPSDQAEPQIWLSVKPNGPKGPWGQSPAVYAGKVPRFNRDTDKREMPMSYGFAHACRSTMASCMLPGSHLGRPTKFVSMKKKVRIQRPRRTLHLDTRVTQKESDIIKRKAEECGLTTSDYVRRCILGLWPRAHLRT